MTVNVRQLRYEEFDKIFVNALADDVGPDIISVHTRNLRKYENRLAPMPTSVRVAKVTVEGQYQPETVVTLETNAMPSYNSIKQNYVAAVADDIVIGNQMFGLPLTIDTLALIYNKDLLDKAGVPIVPSSWDATDFLAAVKKATKYDKKGAIVQSGVALGTGNNIDNAFDIVSLLLMQNGVTLARGSRASFADTLERNLNDQNPILQALRFYTDFARPSKEVYAWNEKFSNSTDEFTRGKVVFLVGFAYDFNRVRRAAPQLNVAVAPIPQLNPGAPTNVANYWLESVVRKSRHKNEAWDFVRFLSEPDRIKRYSEATGIPSPLRVHIEGQKALPLLGPFASQILTAKNWYRGRDIDVASRAIRDMITRYLAPYNDQEANRPLERDASIIRNAQTVVQQTY